MTYPRILSLTTMAIRNFPGSTGYPLDKETVASERPWFRAPSFSWSEIPGDPRQFNLGILQLEYSYAPESRGRPR